MATDRYTAMDRLDRILDPKWVFLGVIAIGLVSLSLAQRYYGTLYRGWDAQFYYSLAHSLIFDQDVDITNNLMLTPRPEPFDRNGDGFWESAPRSIDGRIPTKYPLGMSLVESPLVAVALPSKTI